MCSALICYLLLLSTICGEEIRVAVLPIVELNAAARQRKFAETHTKAIRHQLAGREGIRLIEHEDVEAAIRRSGIRSKFEFEDATFLTKLVAAVKADLIVAGSFSYFGTLALNATYFDLRVYDGTGALAGWTFEQADRVRVASMTISSPAMEQMERMGSHLAAAIFEAKKSKQHIQAGKLILVLPFVEAGESVYGAGLARMFETNVSDSGHFLPMRPPSERMNSEAIRKWAKSKEIEFLFEGEVITNTDEPSVIRITRSDLKTSQTRRVEQAFTSDIDLRLVMTNLARRFAAGGEHIVWQLDRFRGRPLFTTPLFTHGMLVLGVPGPSLLALDPIRGTEKWNFSQADFARSVGEYFHTPVLWGEATTARGPQGPSIFRRHVTDEKKLFLSAAYSPKSRVSALDSHLLAEGDTLFCPTGGNEVIAFQDKGVSRPEVIWVYSAFSKVGFARGKMSKHLLVYSSNGRLAALRKEDGKPVWERQLPDRLHAAALVSGPHVFAACENGERLCLNLDDGKTVWSMKQKGRSLAAPFAWDGKVCFSDEGGQLLACRISDGSKLWSSRISSSPRLALASYAGHLYLPGTDGRLHCMNGEDGKIRWSVKIGSSIHCAPVIVSTDALLADPDADPAPWTERFDHAIYVTTIDGSIFALGGNAP